MMNKLPAGVLEIWRDFSTQKNIENVTFFLLSKVGYRSLSNQIVHT